MGKVSNISKDSILGKMKEYLIKSKEGYERFILYNEYRFKNARFQFDEISRLNKIIGENEVLTCWMCSSFSELGCNIRNLQEFLIGFYDFSLLMKDVFNSLIKVKEKQVGGFIESNLDIFVYDIALSNTSIASPRMFTKRALPELKWIPTK